MCGWNKELLETSRTILERAGFRLDLVTSVEQAGQLLERRDRQYVALLACHTLPVDMQDALQTIALRAETPVYRMEKVPSPDRLVVQVASFLEKG
jgi:DNA-binding NtrC family response regulator